MDRKAHLGVLFCPSTRGGAGSGRPTGLISRAGHTHRQPGQADLEFRPSETPAAVLLGVILFDAASWSEQTAGYSPALSRAAGSWALRHVD
jgi:hypothetical protein